MTDTKRCTCLAYIARPSWWLRLTNRAEYDRQKAAYDAGRCVMCHKIENDIKIYFGAKLRKAGQV